MWIFKSNRIICDPACAFLFILNVFLLPSKALNPGCECVRYTNTWGKEWGSFGSPDYPQGYQRGIHCLLYSFSAPPGFIVHLQIEQLSLPKPQKGYHLNNGCLDFLKLFLHVDEIRGSGRVSGGVNENTPWTSLLCGEHRDLNFHSSSRHLVIQFHSAVPEVAVPKGEFAFVGRYKFLNSSEFVSTGRLMGGTKCDYQFVGSEDLGHFFSPRFPSNYPNNIRCTYHFHASLHKRVRVVFEAVSLQPGEYSCLNKTDVIRVMDGPSSNSPIIALICNQGKDVEVLSSGPHLQVEFLANSDNPGTGFRARYHFVPVQMEDALEYSRPLSPGSFNGEGGLIQASTLVPQCNQVITSDAGRNGSFSSPNYPHHYPPRTECRYVFIGHGRERVQLSFTDFSLFHPTENGRAETPPAFPFMVHLEALGIGGNSSEALTLISVQNYLRGNKRNQKSGKRRCLAADSVVILETSKSKLEEYQEFCGPELPPPIMSSGHRLSLEFRGGSNNAFFFRGFHANYAFTEDFGVRTGRQLRDYPCGFVHNSSETSSGEFSSPNFPGIYPRDTECHYFFYGERDDHVLLTFSYFHVEGIQPCLSSTSSDYLEFSNYMSSDPSYTRLCTQSPLPFPFRLISETNFFRVTFRSNDAFDGGGFLATFHFTSRPKEELIAEHDHSKITLLLPGQSPFPQDPSIPKGDGNTAGERSSPAQNFLPGFFHHFLFILLWVFW